MPPVSVRSGNIIYLTALRIAAYTSVFSATAGLLLFEVVLVATDRTGGGAGVPVFPWLG